MKLISKQTAKDKGLTFYFTGKPCGRDHVSERQVNDGSCRECKNTYRLANKEKSAEQKKAYNIANKEKQAAQKKIYYEANKEEITAQAKAYYEANKEKKAAQQKAYREANKETLAAQSKIYSANNREKRNASAKENSKKPHVKAANACRDMLRRVLKITNATKHSRTFEALGYTADELREHIASQFVEGMSWENYAYDTWHIDHIKPIKAFMDEGIKDPAIINALSNLQPLWAEDNMQKGANYLLA